MMRSKSDLVGSGAVRAKCSERGFRRDFPFRSCDGRMIQPVFSAAFGSEIAPSSKGIRACDEINNGLIQTVRRWPPLRVLASDLRFWRNSINYRLSEGVHASLHIRLVAIVP